MKYIGCFFLALLWMSLSNAQSQTTPAVKVQMRDSGYTLGDYIHQRIQLHLPSNHALSAESLPLTGYVKPWLDLSNLVIEQKDEDVEVILTWQVFATVEMSQQLRIPELVMKTEGPSPLTIRVPAQPFYYSSVLPQSVAGIHRRVDVPPKALDEMLPLLWAITFTFMGSLLYTCWLWLKDYLPWLPYRLGPMAKLARQMRRRTQAEEAEAEDIVNIHRSLNAAAGESLYPTNLSQLFTSAPYLQTVEQDIRHFFKNTWYWMYTQTDAQNALSGQNESPLPHGFTLDWIEKAAVAERLFNRNARQRGTYIQSAAS